MQHNENGIYKLPKENLPKFEKMLEKLSRKSVKLTGERIYFVPFNTSTEKLPNGRVQEYVEVLLSGFEAPKLNGWEFVARLDHANEAGNIIRPVPGFAVPERYRTVGTHCEHCGRNRYRRDTYLVRNEAGEIKQIGRQCMKDFLGHQHPENIAKMAELLGYADEYARGAMVIGTDQRYIDLETYLSHVALMIENHGYMSKSKMIEINSKQTDERKMVTSTGNLAHISMFPDAKYKDTMPVPSDANVELAKAAQTWAAELGEDGTELNDYMHNIHVIAASGMIEFRSMNYAASIIGTYMREHSLFPKKEAAPVKLESGFVGEVGGKLEVTVTYTGRYTMQNDAGEFYVYYFLDDKGNKFSWMTGKVLENEKGSTLTLKGSIKAHDDYKGEKRTVMTRCKVL